MNQSRQRLGEALELIDTRLAALDALHQEIVRTPYHLGRGIESLDRWLQTSCTLLARAGLPDEAQRLAERGYMGTGNPIMDVMPRMGAYQTCLKDLRGELERDPSILDVQSQQEPKMAAEPRRVAVVHGRNEFAKRGMFDFLRALDLKPVEWEEAVRDTGRGAPYNREILEALFDRTQAVVVLITGDEDVALRPSLCRTPEEGQPRRQARANVYIEAGMALLSHPQRTIFVVLGQQDLSSDLHGLNYVLFDGTPESRNRLKARLETAGCAVQGIGDWLESGGADFKTALAL